MRGMPLPPLASLLEPAERVARVVLWLSISSACVVAPVFYIRNRQSDDERRKEAAREEEQEKKRAAEREERRAHESQRIPIASLGVYMSSLNPFVGGEQGKVWVANVSARSGYLCVVGTATNRGTRRTSSSLASCEKLGAYATGVRVGLTFAGGELGEVCPKAGECELVVRDAVEGGA